MNEELKRLYYDPKTGFGSAAHLFRAAKKSKVAEVTMKHCVDFIARQETAQVHKGTNEKQEKRQFHIESKRGYWQCDHCFMKHTKANNGYKAIFVAVDIGSRYVYARAMKNIRETAVIETFEDFLKTVKPKNVRGIVNDQGNEFISHSLRNWLKDHNIEQRTLHPTYHYYSNAIVERFNGVLKQKLAKYKTSHGTKKWVDALDDIVYNNNRSLHSTTKQRPKDMLKSPLKQLIFRLKTINSNHNLRAKKNFVLNKIEKGSTIRIKRIPKDHFDKSYKKYNKKEHEVEAIVNGGVMVKVKGESRPLRPFEILPVGMVEKNPLKLKVKATEGTKRAKVKRIRNDALIRELKKQREKPKREDQTNRGVAFEVKGERVEGRVVRMSDNNDGGMFVEYILKNKRYGERMTVDDVTFLEHAPKLNITTTKRVIVRREAEVDDDDTKEQVEYINSQKVLAVKTEHEDKFWLAKNVGKVRRAVVEDEQRSGGTVKAGKWIITGKWYENTGIPRTYYLSKGNNYISISSVYIVKDLNFETTDRKANKFTLSVRDRNRILKVATTTDTVEKEKEKQKPTTLPRRSKRLQSTFYNEDKSKRVLERVNKKLTALKGT